MKQFKFFLVIIACLMVTNVAWTASRGIRSGDTTSSEIKKTVLSAIENGMIHPVEAFIEQYPGQIKFVRNGNDLRPALIYAANRGNIKIMKLLLDNGVDVNEPDTYGFTALYCTVDAGYPVATRFLLDHGANLHAPKKRNREDTPYNLAVKRSTYNPTYKKDILDLLDEYEPLKIIDVSAFRQTKPTLEMFTKDAENPELTEEEQDVALQLAIQKFERADYEFFYRLTQEAYEDFLKGNPAPLREFFFNFIFTQYQGMIGIIKQFFKSDNAFYALLRKLAQTPQEVEMVQEVIRTDIEVEQQKLFDQQWSDYKMRTKDKLLAESLKNPAAKD